MAITIIEMTKRYTNLKKIGEKIGFEVEENEEYITWILMKETYYLIPYVGSCKIPDKLASKLGNTIAVSLDDKFADTTCKNALYSEIVNLEKEVRQKHITKENAQDIWKLIYGKGSISHALQLARIKSDSKPSGKSPTTGTENEQLVEDEEKPARTTVVTARGPESYIELIKESFQTTLKPLGKKMYCSDDDVLVLQLVSKLYPRTKYDEYWYSVHSYQIEEMKKHKKGYYSFGFSEKNIAILIEKEKFLELLPLLTESPNNGDVYWHIKIHTNEQKDFYRLKTKKGEKDIDITEENGILIVDNGTKNQHKDIKSTSPKITLTTTELREVSVKKKKR